MSLLKSGAKHRNAVSVPSRGIWCDRFPVGEVSLPLMIPALGEPPRGGTPIRTSSKPTNAPRGGGRLKQKKSFYFKP